MDNPFGPFGTKVRINCTLMCTVVSALLCFCFWFATASSASFWLIRYKLVEFYLLCLLEKHFVFCFFIRKVLPRNPERF